MKEFSKPYIHGTTSVNGMATIRADKYTPTQIVDYIQHKLDRMITYQIVSEGDAPAANITVVYKLSDERNAFKLSERIVAAASYAIQWLTPKSYVKFENRPINVSVYLTGLTKRISRNTKNISTINVNSGWSIGSHTIVIYRAEEAPKVIIHELVHAFDVDGNRHGASAWVDAAVANSLPQHLRIHEAYTEFLATHILAISGIGYNINLQTAHSRGTIMSINQHMYDGALRKKDWLARAELAPANVYSYYFLKWGMLMAHDAIIKKASDLGFATSPEFIKWVVDIARKHIKYQHTVMTNSIKTIFQHTSFSMAMIKH
jgi:hypothetical protein